MSKGSHGTGSTPGSPETSTGTEGLASTITQAAQDKVRTVAEQQKSAAAEQVGNVAQMVDTVADEVERGLPPAAPYLREMAARVHRASSALRERPVEDLVQDVGKVVRRRPAAFLGGCLAAGFAMARFLKSSADRRSRSEAMAQSRTRPAGGSRPNMAARSAGTDPTASLSTASGASVAADHLTAPSVDAPAAGSAARTTERS